MERLPRAPPQGRIDLASTIAAAVAAALDPLREQLQLVVQMKTEFEGFRQEWNDAKADIQQGDEEAARHHAAMQAEESAAEQRQAAIMEAERAAAEQAAANKGRGVRHVPD